MVSSVKIPFFLSCQHPASLRIDEADAGKVGLPNPSLIGFGDRSFLFLIGVAAKLAGTMKGNRRNLRGVAFCGIRQWYLLRIVEIPVFLRCDVRVNVAEVGVVTMNLRRVRSKSGHDAGA